MGKINIVKVIRWISGIAITLIGVYVWLWFIVTCLGVYK